MRGPPRPKLGVWGGLLTSHFLTFSQFIKVYVYFTRNARPWDKGSRGPRHRHQEWIKFLNQIDRETPADLDIHLIVDNYATHKHPKVEACSGAPDFFDCSAGVRAAFRIHVRVYPNDNAPTEAGACRVGSGPSLMDRPSTATIHPHQRRQQKRQLEANPARGGEELGSLREEPLP